MNRSILLATVSVLCLLAVTAAVALAWSDVDPTTGTGPDFMASLPLDDQSEPAVAYNPDDDQYLVVWGDKRGSYTDIYGQILSYSGIPQRDNIVVSNAADDQSDPLVAYNSTDHNYMVVWRDQRNGTDYDVYGQVISSSGTLSGTNFTVNTETADQRAYDLIYDPNANHYLVVWWDNGDNRVEGQLLDPAGGLLPPNAFAIASGYDIRAAYNSNRSSYMVVYEQANDIYGQAIAADGTLSGSAFVICGDAANQFYPNLAFNSSSHEYLVVWQDYRNTATTGTDVYARRIDEDGVVQGDEIVVANAADGQDIPDVAYNSRVNQWLVSWHDYRDSTTSGRDVYGQRVLSSGSLAGQGNFAIYDGPDDQRDVALAARPTLLGAEYLAVWEDDRSAYGEIVGQRVGALLGTLNWHDFNVSAPLENQEHPRVVYNTTTQQFFVAWQDERDGDSDIYAQIVLTTGIPLGYNIVVRDEANQLVDPAVAHSTISNTYTVLWDDQAEGDIEGRVVNANGTLGGAFNVYDTAGFTGTQPAIIYNSSAHQYLAVFVRKTAAGSQDIYGRLIWPSGTMSGTAFAISSNAAAQSLPQAAYNATDDEYLVVWSDARTDTADVYGRRVDADGTLLGSDAFTVATGTDAQNYPAVAWNSDDNEYLVVWHDYRDSGTTGADVYGRRVGADGSLQGNEIALCTASEHQQYARVTYISTYERYFAIWQDNRDAASGWDIYGQNVNGDGSLYGENVARFVFSGWQQRPDGAFSPEANRGLTVWQDGRNGDTFKIYGRIKEPRFPIYLPLVLRNY